MSDYESHVLKNGVEPDIETITIKAMSRRFEVSSDDTCVRDTGQGTDRKGPPDCEGTGS